MNKFTIASYILILPVFCIIFQACHKDDPDPTRCRNCPIAYKPNIYIYPLKETSLNVNLIFPKGGKVITSIPYYKDGWNINITPSGKINGAYDYLFYESEQPDEWQKETGWLVSQDTLQRFFEHNLSAYNFKQHEIKDFTDYWIPRFKGHKFYIVYPQEKAVIDQLIYLNFSQQPDAISRLFYVVKFSDSVISVKEHKINSTSRNGFNVAEWGVILE